MLRGRIASPYVNFGVRINLFVNGQSALGQIQGIISKSLLPEHIRYPPENAQEAWEILRTFAVDDWRESRKVHAFFEDEWHAVG